jgi:hypothetical protein
MYQDLEFCEEHSLMDIFARMAKRRSRSFEVMNIVIPAYIEARIRRPPPEWACVVPGSTPVLAFGDARTARVATLGLNPSRIEFTDKAGILLEGEKRRLATHASLGLSDLAASSSRMVSNVLEDCNRYFQRQPYKSWFNKLETPILAACNASYYDGTACHLDLVQWATDPTWGKLPLSVRRKLIIEDAAFLISQLQNESIRLLLVNGASVWRQLRLAASKELSVEHAEVIDGCSHLSTRLHCGRLFGKVCVVAWSTNLQSSFGVTTLLREELGRRAACFYAQSSQKS